MRVCCPPHAAIKIARRKQLLWKPLFPFPRPFTSTVSTRSPSHITSIHSDSPHYEPQAQPNSRAKNVAVVGGGITGLTAAYNLMKALPNATITLFESREKLGGWLDSEIVPVDDGEVLFEWGPRTLRSDGIGAGRYTAQLMAQLDMAEDILPTSATSPAALNRFIYYPDHLVRMPGRLPDVGLLTSVVTNILNIHREPIFEGAIRGLFNEPDVEIRSKLLQDESVGDFISRRFGQNIADNLVSALLHGIYAGDLYKLSARTIFPLLWHLEGGTEYGTMGDAGVIYKLMHQMFIGESFLPYEDIEFALQSDQITKMSEGPAKAVAAKLERSSVYTFQKGLAQLAQRIEAALRESKNVKIKHMNVALAFDSKTKQFRITDRRKKDTGPSADRYDYVVAAISAPQLRRALQYDNPSPSLTTSPTTSSFTTMLHRLSTSSQTVNVMVVNLFYRDPHLLPIRGFGYLIPRTIALEQNPERALGVIFGSETSRASFSSSSNSPPFDPSDQIRPPSQDTTPGTKLTIMLGGHWWDSWAPSDLPSPSTAIEMAKSLLARHLGITADPLVARARMQWDAIPQYEVGHRARMARLHGDLGREFGGRLKVAGSAYHGVGVNDCVKAGRKAGFDIREGLDGRTGLEGFVGEERWAVFKRREGVVYLEGRGDE